MITIQLSGDAYCYDVYKKFTQRHPRYPLIQNKRWGMALLRVPADFDQYLAGKGSAELRLRRNRCLRRGYRFARLRPLDVLDQILDINRSLPTRQGRPMERSYLEVEALREYFAARNEIFGVLDDRGILKAYVDAPVIGEVSVLSRVLGHGDALADKVMYLCMTEVIREMSESRSRQNRPEWILYDRFYGGTPRLRYFKERFKFKPFNIRWRWAES